MPICIFLGVLTLISLSSPSCLFHPPSGLKGEHSVVDLEGGTKLDAQSAEHIMPLQNEKASTIDLFVEENLCVSLRHSLLHQVLAHLRRSR